MPSLKVLATTIAATGDDLRRGRLRRGIIASLRAGLCACLLAPLCPAQDGQRDVPARDKQEDDGPGNEFKKLSQDLLREYFVRYPDQAIQRRWLGAPQLTLGTFGTEAELRWRDALGRARSRLEALIPPDRPLLARAQHEALAAKLRGELLLLDSQAKTRTDPAGYVQRAGRVLQAVNESTWLTEQQRNERLQTILEELPTYWADARKSLVTPIPQWIDVALLDLDDLEELVKKIEEALPAPAAQPKNPRQSRPGPSPRASIQAFRRWLLDTHDSSGNLAPVLGPTDWIRLVQEVSGTDLSTSEIKARCLRGLADIDPLETSKRTAFPPAAVDPKLVASNVWNASARSLALAHAAGLVSFPLGPTNLEVATEESPRTREEIIWLRGGIVGSIRAYIELPSKTWSEPMATTRLANLLPRSQVALGVRHGLAGESMFAFHARGIINRHKDRLLASFLQNRPVLEGVGLYALDWVLRVDWVDNPYRDEPALEREFALLRTFEAARLLATLEIHAEGLSLSEATESFRRRTGVDPETAATEVLAALRDPLTGIGCVALFELQALEEEFASFLPTQRALALTLRVTTSYPELRPSDLLAAVQARFPR